MIRSNLFEGYELSTLEKVLSPSGDVWQEKWPEIGGHLI
jgi:hypothetical protein